MTAGSVPGGWSLVRAEVRRAWLRGVVRNLPMVALVLTTVVVGGAMVGGVTYDGTDLASTLRESARLVIPVAATIGAAVMGAWFASGTVTSLALWEPRRGRLLVVQVFAAAIVTGAVTAMACCWFGVVLAVWAAWSGAGPDGSAVAAALAVVGAIGVASVGAAWLGAAVGVIVRSATAAIVIVALGHLIVEQVIVQVVYGVTDRAVPGVLPIGSFVDAVAPAMVDPPSAPGSGAWSAIAATTWLALLTVAAVALHRRRDLT